MPAIAGLDFDEAWARRDAFQLNELSCPVLSIEDTIGAAKASNRSKDRARVRALQKAIEVRSRLRKPSK
jgi:hypothetical protein